MHVPFMENSSELEKNMDSELLTESSLFDVNKPLKLYFNRKHALRKSTLINVLSPLFVALPVIFILLLFWLLKTIFGDTGKELQALSYFCVAFFTLLAIPSLVFVNVLSHRAFKEALKPAIEVDLIGITINCAGRNYKKIPWEQIQEVRTFKIYGWNYVRVIPHDPSILSQYECEDETQSGRILHAFLKKLIVLSKFSSMGISNEKLNKVYSQPHIDIPDEFLPLGAQEVVESINLRLKNTDKML